MKIAFHGAARTVTGSKHLITLKSGIKILLDCGMFQGMGKETDAMNRNLGFVASEVDVMFLSHAHIDHTGLIPKLVKEGFKGKFFVHQQQRNWQVYYWKILQLFNARIQNLSINEE